MLSTILPAESYRKYLSKQVRKGPLARYLQQPLPGRNRPVTATEFLALDFETTGLDARREAVLCAGFTVVRDGRVVLRENGHYVIQINRLLPKESVVIHKITDHRMRQGIHLHELMEILLEKLAGRVLLVHYAQV
ncbi:MAG TPA: hypothetical protein EYH03_00945, partial [Chromatiales bacterium]|nr:hypothetical protein [Chromatiales bacterium]